MKNRPGSGGGLSLYGSRALGQLSPKAAQPLDLKPFSFKLHIVGKVITVKYIQVGYICWFGENV